MKKDFLRALRLGTVLFLICGLSAALMAYVRVRTAAPIADASEHRLTEGFRLLIPEFDNAIMKTGARRKNGCVVYTAMKGNRILGKIVTASVTNGYAGEIDGMASFGTDGTMTGFLITRHGETPGLGGNVCTREEKKTILTIFSKEETKDRIPPNSFLDGFIGHRYSKDDSWKSDWRIRKDGGHAEQVSGATITSRAVAGLAAKAAKALLEEEK